MSIFSTPDFASAMDWSYTDVASAPVMLLCGGFALGVLLCLDLVSEPPKANSVSKSVPNSWKIVNCYYLKREWAAILNLRNDFNIVYSSSNS